MTARTLTDADMDPRLLAARLQRMQKHRVAAAQTPGLADPQPLGSGPLNRHGMPKLPVGQTPSKKWPVLDLGIHPQVALGDWRLTVDGAVTRPLQLSWQDLLALPQEDQHSDFHCVTTWSQMDLRFEGVALATVLALAEPAADASHLMLHAYDGYTTNLSLAEACKPDVLLAHRVDGAPLPREHGGPLRVVTPQLYAWKGAKWVCRLEVMTADRPGFWEQRGYSMTAHPWRDDRYG